MDATDNTVTGVIRHILTFAGGIAVTKGWVDASTLSEIVGALATLIGVGWSIATKNAAKS